ncbi:hypothetical protein F511_34689 [Dorcoceras hygrometricum]|uniref:Retrotransposon Copia-like N-terminal domain-containing protein n=1 Tax=Dorcoceras hygrometricum TaxID=472368 RepID=A0A2Z7D4G6_9LAMI|nr:hypothetical protein F511_34689 [Dorcoceras hygrometricum]
MLIALSVKNKIGFIDGSIAQPDSSDPVLLNSWHRNNNIVISWILNSVSKEISASIIFAESAALIWLDLKDRFQQSNGPRIFQLRRELINLAQEQLSVSHYFTKLKGLWDELSNFRPNCTCGKCTCGGVKELTAHHQMEYVMAFLMGLNDTYAQIRGQLLLLDPLPPINKVFSLISQEERQRTIGPQSTNNSQTMAFAVKGDSKRKNVATTAMKQSRGSRRDNNNRPFCTECHIHGHTVDTCYKIHGYPPGYQRAKSIE